MEDIKTVGVVGCGTIGLGWATYFALKGLKVNLYDQQIATLDNAGKKIEENLKFLMSVEVIEESQFIDIMNRIETFSDLQKSLSDVDFVQESIFEDYSAKKQMYYTLDQLLPGNIIVASSSSGLLMTEIQKSVNRYPERCVIGHPINPVYLMPLIEIVPGKLTIDQTIQRAKAFYEKIEKIPVVLKKEVPGYIENRLTAALWREAIDLVVNDVASVEDVDKTIWAGPGLRYALMGPHLIYHLGGGEGGIKYFIHHLEEAFTQWWEDMNCWTKIPEGASDKLNDGIIKSIEGKDVKNICAWRDKELVKLLKTIDIKKTYTS